MKTILILDSCTLTRECLSTILRAKGYRVQSSAMIAQAKAMIAKRPPDLIITEIRLPDDNVLNFMRSLKGDPSCAKTKVCLLTQAAAKKPIMEAIELGVCKVMLKSKFTVAGFIEQIGAIGAAAAAQSNSASTQEPQASIKLSFPVPTPAKDPSLALKEVKPIIARAALKERLEEMEELCTINPSISSMLQAIDSPDTEIEEVADMVKMDQTVAMKVMRIANSIEYARGEQTMTLKDAIIRIGLEQLRILISGIGIVENLKEDQSAGPLDHTAFWDHALAVAACSQKIATQCKGVNPEVVFTAAILHDVGRVILQQVLPEEYAQVLETADKLGVGLDLTEKRMLLSDHTTIGQSILGSWNLPKELVDAVGNHHCEPSKLSTMCPKNTQIAAIVELSNRIIHAMGIGCSGNKILSATEDLFPFLDIEEGISLEFITQDLQENIIQMRASIYPSDSTNQDSISLAPAPVFDRAFHPLYISMNPEHDAIGHWINTNADESDSGQLPNIAIIHARLPKDKQDLIDKLEAELAKHEFDSTAQPIPLLILSPNGRTALQDSTLSAHPTQILMTPFSILHFEETVNHLLNGMVRAIEPRTMRNAA